MEGINIGDGKIRLLIESSDKIGVDISFEGLEHIKFSNRSDIARVAFREKLTSLIALCDLQMKLVYIVDNHPKRFGMLESRYKIY